MASFPGGGSAITSILVVNDVDASVAWYRDVLGADLERTYGESAVLKIFGTWLVLVHSGGPTEDKPETHMSPPQDLNQVSHVFTIRVEDCHAAYRELVERGATFIRPPFDHGHEIRCFFRDPDGHLFEISQV